MKNYNHIQIPHTLRITHPSSYSVFLWPNWRFHAPTKHASIFNVIAVNTKGVAFLEASMMGRCQGRGECCINKSVAGVSLSLPSSSSLLSPPPITHHMFTLLRSPNPKRQMLNSRPQCQASILHHSNFLVSFSGGLNFTTNGDSSPAPTSPIPNAL